MWLMYLRINPWIKIFTVVNLTWTRFWSVGFFNFPCCAFYNCVFYFPLQPSRCSGEPYWWAHFDGLHLPTEKKGNIHRHSMHLWPFRSFTLQTSWSFTTCKVLVFVISMVRDSSDFLFVVIQWDWQNSK